MGLDLGWPREKLPSLSMSQYPCALPLPVMVKGLRPLIPWKSSNIGEWLLDAGVTRTLFSFSAILYV